jgi:hypothetical protein
MGHPAKPVKQGSTPAQCDSEALVGDHEWIYARTMPTIPHFYVVRGKGDCAEGDWDAFAAYIKEHGYRAAWTAPNGNVMVNTYLEQGEWKYWAIYPVINRERIENSTTVRLEED